MFAGYVALLLIGLAFVIERRAARPAVRFTVGTWANYGLGAAIVVAGSVMLHWGYGWLLDAHAYAACAMFVFLAAAGLGDCYFGFTKKHTKTIYASLYGIVGASMLIAGLLFVIYQSHHRSALGGHLVLVIEAIEIGLFASFWAVQTVERWNQTV